MLNPAVRTHQGQSQILQNPLSADTVELAFGTPHLANAVKTRSGISPQGFDNLPRYVAMYRGNCNHLKECRLCSQPFDAFRYVPNDAAAHTPQCKKNVGYRTRLQKIRKYLKNKRNTKREWGAGLSHYTAFLQPLQIRRTHLHAI